MDDTNVTEANRRLGKKQWYFGVFILFSIFIIVITLNLSYNSKDTYHLLIVGDSIGEGAGASDPVHKWYRLLIPFLEERYKCQVEITNVSIGGSSSYAGYVQIMELDRKEEFDLIIICYGENDAEEEFSLYYEVLLRTLSEKYPASPKLAILESSQQEYTFKIKMIQSLCRHYGVYIADTIQGFADSGLPYDVLCDDGVHPNDEGQKVYYDMVKAAIEALPEERGTEVGEATEPVNEEALGFDVIQYIPFKRFSKVDEFTYELPIDASGRLGIDYTTIEGENNITVLVDGESVADKKIVWTYGFRQQRIEVLLNRCVIKEKIQICFSSTDQAESFHGIILSKSR